MPARPGTPTGHATILGRIRLRHLQCFLAIARLGTLRGAAQALSVTQPAVTKTLNELEDLLGTPLFERGRKGARLTPEAEVFLLHANASVNALAQAVDSVVHGADEAALRIGVLPSVAPFVARVLQAYAGERAGAAVRVQGGRNAELVELLRRRELDVVIGRLSDPDAMAGLTFEHLYAEPMIVVVRPAHPLLARGRELGAELADHPFVLPLPGTLIRQVVDGYLASRGLAPRAGLVETLETSLARTLVQIGSHLWFTPRSAALPDLDAGTLARLPIEITPDEPVGLLRRTDQLPSAALAAWLGLARSTAAEHRERPLEKAPRRRRPASDG